MNSSEQLAGKAARGGDFVARLAGAEVEFNSLLGRRYGADCLVLDEPTNHPDLPAIEQLEQALAT